MQIDRKMLERLGQLDDARLEALIREIARTAGIDPSVLGIDPQNIQSIRAALRSTADEDLARLNDIYETYRRRQRERE